MSRGQIVWRVTRREIRERGRTKAFLLTTMLFLAAAVAAGIVPAYLDQGEDVIDVAVVGEVPADVSTALRFASAGNPDLIHVVDVPSRAAGDVALRRGNVDLVLDGTTAIRVRGARTGDRVRVLAARLAGILSLRTSLGSVNVPSESVERILATAPLPIDELEPRREDASGARGAVSVGTLVLYLALVAYGSWVATGVLEEKASRVVEVVLAAVRPSDLLAGKVLGIGLLGLGQLVLVAGGGLAAALATAVDVPSSAPGAVGLVIVWFVLGFAFYSCAFAALGAAASRHEDAQLATSPLIGLLLGGFLLSAAVQADPDGTLAQIASFLPPLAPLTVPARVLLGNPPPWEVTMSVVLMLAGSYGLIRLGARAYGGAVLRFGAKLGFREIYRGALSGASVGVECAASRSILLGPDPIGQGVPVSPPRPPARKGHRHHDGGTPEASGCSS